MQQSLSNPAFGEADLSNCETEQIHLAGSIQPHGALLLVRESDFQILQASENAASVLGVAGPLQGLTLEAVGGDLATCLRDQKHQFSLATPVALRCNVGAGAAFDVLAHRPPDGGLIVELEIASPPVEVSALLAEAFDRIVGSPLPPRALRRDRQMFKAIAGYDRVMVYRFDDDGHGEVFSESREPELEPFLGNRYPGVGHPPDRPQALHQHPRAVAGGCRLRAGPPHPRASRRSPGATSTCRSAPCAACRRSTSSTSRTWASARPWWSRWSSAASCGGWWPATTTRRASCPTRSARCANFWRKRSRPGSPRWKASCNPRRSCRSGASSSAWSTRSPRRATGAARCSTSRCRCCSRWAPAARPCCATTRSSPPAKFRAPTSCAS